MTYFDVNCTICDTMKKSTKLDLWQFILWNVFKLKSVIKKKIALKILFWAKYGPLFNFNVKSINYIDGIYDKNQYRSLFLEKAADNFWEENLADSFWVCRQFFLAQSVCEERAECEVWKKVSAKSEKKVTAKSERKCLTNLKKVSEKSESKCLRNLILTAGISFCLFWHCVIHLKN